MAGTGHGTVGSRHEKWAFIHGSRRRQQAAAALMFVGRFRRRNSSGARREKVSAALNVNQVGGIALKAM